MGVPGVGVGLGFSVGFGVGVVLGGAGVSLGVGVALGGAVGFEVGVAVGVAGEEAVGGAGRWVGDAEGVWLGGAGVERGGEDGADADGVGVGRTGGFAAAVGTRCRVVGAADVDALAADSVPPVDGAESAGVVGAWFVDVGSGAVLEAAETWSAGRARVRAIRWRSASVTGRTWPGSNGRYWAGSTHLPLR